MPSPQGGAEFAPRADVELAVGVREVDLDRLRGDEEFLGDLAVGLRFRRHRRDPALARGQRLDPAAGPARRPLARPPHRLPQLEPPSRALEPGAPLAQALDALGPPQLTDPPQGVPDRLRRPPD